MKQARNKKTAKRTARRPLFKLHKALKAGEYLNLAEVHDAAANATEYEVVGFTLALKNMRRCYLEKFATLTDPEAREEAWQHGERCRECLYLITTDARYNVARDLQLENDGSFTRLKP